MMSAEELEKLKVPDLKKELKTRGLAASGNKADLIQRLSEHIVSEEKQILQGDGSSNNDESNLDVPEDAVLGLLASPQASNGGSAPVKLSKPANITSTDSPTPADKPKPVSSTHSTEKTPITPPRPQVPITTGKISLKKNAIASVTSPVKADPPAAPVEKSIAAIKVLTAEERRIERAKKFNTEISAEDRKKLRADRFGSDSASTGNVSKPKTENTAALQKRAERFGIPLKATGITSKPGSTEAREEMKEKLKQRADRFGGSNVTNLAAISAGKVAVSVDDSKVKLLKRKERFGPATAKEETEEKKQKRADRFSIRK